VGATFVANKDSAELFLPSFGPGKIPAEAFFLPFFQETLWVWGMLGV
jgi:hypothetical protein